MKPLRVLFVLVALVYNVGANAGTTTQCYPEAGGGMRCDTLTAKEEAQRAKNMREGMTMAQKDFDRWCSDPAAWSQYLEDSIRKGWLPDSQQTRNAKPKCR